MARPRKIDNSIDDTALKAENVSVTPPKPIDFLYGQMAEFGLISPDAKNGQPLDRDELRALPKKDIKKLQEALSDSGLYVPEGHDHYADGKIGKLTEHGLAIAADPSLARRHIEKTLRQKDIDKDDLMQLQASLNRLEFDAGDIDGKMGRNTATALGKFLAVNPSIAASADPSLIKSLSSHLGGGLRNAFDKAAEPDADAYKLKHTPTDPAIAKLLDKHPERRQFFDMAYDAALNHKLNPEAFAKQIYQESRFNPEAKGPKTRFGTALGIAQFLPGTADSVGVNRADLRNDDPKAVERVLDGAARHMADLKKNYGSQELAMVAYNGGGRAIDDALDSINAKLARKGLPQKDSITIADWSEEMVSRRAKLEAKMVRQGRDPSDPSDFTTKERSAWHVQTLDYVRAAYPPGRPDQPRQPAPAAPAAPQGKTDPMIAEHGGTGSVFSSAFGAATSLANNVAKYSESANSMFGRMLSSAFTGATIQDTPADKVAPSQMPALKDKGPEIAPPAPAPNNLIPA